MVFAICFALWTQMLLCSERQLFRVWDVKRGELLLVLVHLVIQHNSKQEKCNHLKAESALKSF